MTRPILTRKERDGVHARNLQAKWERMSDPERDAFIMRAMDEALTARSAVTKQDLRLAGIPEDAIGRRWPVLLPLVINARTEHLPVMGVCWDNS